MSRSDINYLIRNVFTTGGFVALWLLFRHSAGLGLAIGNAVGAMIYWPLQRRRAKRELPRGPGDEAA